MLINWLFPSFFYHALQEKHIVFALGNGHEKYNLKRNNVKVQDLCSHFASYGQGRP